MKYIKDTINNLKYILCKELKSEVFHITSEIGYKGILKDKAIYPSNHKNIKKHIWGFSEYGRYFTNENCVSVVDFYNNINNKLTIKAIKKYRFYDIHSVAHGEIAYFLVLKSSLYNKLITSQVAWKDIEKNNRYGEQIVPHFESGIKNKILLSDIEYTIKVETIEKYVDYSEIYADMTYTTKPRSQ